MINLYSNCCHILANSMNFGYKWGYPKRERSFHRQASVNWEKGTHENVFDGNGRAIFDGVVDAS